MIRRKIKTALFLGLIILSTLDSKSANASYSSSKLSRQTERTMIYEPPGNGKESIKANASFSFGETDTEDTFSVFNLGLMQSAGKSVDLGVQLGFLSYLDSEGFQRSEMGNPKLMGEINIMNWSSRGRKGATDVILSATVPREGYKDLVHRRSDIQAGLKGYHPMEEGFVGADFSITYRTPESNRSLGLLGQFGGGMGWNLLPELSLTFGGRVRHSGTGKLENGDLINPVTLVTLEPEVRIALLNSLVFHFAGYFPVNSESVKGRESNIGGVEVLGLYGPTLLIGTSMSF